MRIRNNSDKEWLNYNCGGIFVDIKAKSTFEVEKPIGEFLIRILGCDAWLVEVDEDVINEEVVEKVDIVVKELADVEIDEEIKEVIEEAIEEQDENDIEPEREAEKKEKKEKKVKKAIICAFCGGKNYRHKKDCTRNK